MRLIATAALTALLALPLHAADDWIEASNAQAMRLLQLQAQFQPEGAARTGVEGFDDRIVDLKPRRLERERKALEDLRAEFVAALEAAEHPKLQQDLQILIESINNDLKGMALYAQHMLPYYAVDRTVFYGIKGLLDPRIPAERQKHAVTRLQRYAGLDGSVPLTELARARTEERLANAELIGPYRAQMEQNLSESDQVIKGLRELFEKSGLDGWQDAMKAFSRQLFLYNQWLRKTLLPRARSDHRLPPEIYAHNLTNFGVDVDPRELMRKALAAFAEIRNEMHTLAPLVAEQHGLETEDYREVIAALKREQIGNDEILDIYNQRLATVEQSLRDEQLVSVPERAASIRLASEAESAILPAPHMSPPRLVGNTGEYGEFVLPLNVPAEPGKEALKMDDFTFDAATWTLTAHESRPGHEMQFAAMIDNGVSIARAVFAFNSVNVEGWALYAEAEMKPDFPLDGQLIGLQHRLMRATRAFMDPMLNLGMMDPEAGREFLMKEVVLSAAMAKQEIDRYTFRAPGQATSYFYGYQRLMETRQRAELALGKRFQRQAFHDFVLAQGLIPPELLEKAVMEEFVPAQRKR